MLLVLYMEQRTDVKCTDFLISVLFFVVHDRTICSYLLTYIFVLLHTYYKNVHKTLYFLNKKVTNGISCRVFSIKDHFGTSQLLII